MIGFGGCALPCTLYIVRMFHTPQLIDALMVNTLQAERRIGTWPGTTGAHRVCSRSGQHAGSTSGQQTPADIHCTQALLLDARKRLQGEGACPAEAPSAVRQHAGTYAAAVILPILHRSIVRLPPPVP